AVVASVAGRERDVAGVAAGGGEKHGQQRWLHGNKKSSSGHRDLAEYRNPHPWRRAASSSKMRCRMRWLALCAVSLLTVGTACSPAQAKPGVKAPKHAAVRPSAAASPAERLT